MSHDPDRSDALSRLTTRRAFLRSTTALLAAGCTRAGSGAEPFVGVPPAGTRGAAGARLPLGFSTLGSPDWEWPTILEAARANGYGAIELRGIRGEMDLTKRPEFAPGRIETTRQQLAEHGLVVTALGASSNLHEPDATRAAGAMDEARRFVDLAQALDAPFVRVFGNNWVEGESRAATIARVAARLRELGDYAGPRGVTIAIESHGDFVDTPSLKPVLEAAGSPAVKLLWDAHHTFVAGEQPEDTVRELGPWIVHTHLKDSVPDATNRTGRRYVLTGEGEVPVRRQVEALARMGYAGWYSFEWEKRWHPELAGPEVAFPHFARVAGEYLRAAGVRERPAR